MPTVDENFVKRIQPHSEEAERSVLGSMLMDRDAIVEAEDILTKEDFYQRQYGIVFEAMVELYREGKAVDLITLQNKLKEKEVPEELMSLDFFRDLVEVVPTAANIGQYAKIVHDKATLRALIKVTENIGKECYLGKEDTETILEKTEKDISSKQKPYVRLCSDSADCFKFFKCHRRSIKDQGKSHRSCYRLYRT